jgi:predicted membrane-bound spermidine synthase
LGNHTNFGGYAVKRVLGNLNRPLTAHDFDAKWGQIICWVISCVVLLGGIRELTLLPLTETELFFGLLLVLAVALLGVLIGLVLPLATSHAHGGQTKEHD